jgi:hypothetical protein
MTIQSGEEKMYCVYLDNDVPDLAVSLMDAKQGDYGHHLVLLSTLEPQPHGTVEDCTDESLMWKFRAFVLPGIELPDGHGIRIPDGMQYVLQFHYVNASSKPILVRDVARLKKIAPAAVTTWTSTLTTNSPRLSLPARQTATETFDCVLAQDVELLVLGGHMHEQGATMDISIGPDVGSLTSFYSVDPWIPEFRDSPPVTLFFENRKHLPQGSIVRTTCNFDNKLNEDIAFPNEMCSAFGYIAGTEEPFHCEPEAT